MRLIESKRMNEESLKTVNKKKISIFAKLKMSTHWSIADSMSAQKRIIIRIAYICIHMKYMYAYDSILASIVPCEQCINVGMNSKLEYKLENKRRVHFAAPKQVYEQES